MKPGACLFVLVGLALSTAELSLLRSQTNSSQGSPVPAASSAEPTVKRLHESGWWPTKRDSVRKDYAGTEACASCHQQEVSTQPQTSMAKAASRPVDTEVLRSMPKLSLETPPFLTTITRERKGGSTYTAARGGEAISGEILLTMGAGNVGQTFILESGGGLLESQLSYFPSIGGLDLTPGHLPRVPSDLQAAFGTLQSNEIAQRCFGCHTTGSSVRGQLDANHATPGVTCEACHGPGAKHVDAMRQGRVDEGRAAILNPITLDPVKLVDYCGACHRAPMDVITVRDYTPINVRFQPYRLSKSPCWSRPDPRITCIACHNPHEEVVRDVSFYDAKCLACHSSRQGDSPVVAKPSETSDKEVVHSDGKLRGCSVGKDRCVSCHMPKYQVQQMHGSFTDHDIRIVRIGEPFPL